MNILNKTTFVLASLAVLLDQDSSAKASANDQGEVGQKRVFIDPQGREMPIRQKRIHKRGERMEFIGIQDVVEEDQTLGNPSKETCSMPVKRLEQEQKDLDYGALLKSTGEDKWTDSSFTFPESISLSELPRQEEFSLAYHVEFIDWKRISELSGFDQTISMWGDSNVEPSDLEQGFIGNCWAIAAISSIAEFPQRIKDMFLVDETNSKGVYAFQMYQLGLPMIVTVDDYLPFVKEYEETDLVYSRITEDNAVWAPLLEKAFAKYLGSYESLVGGFEQFAFMTITGAPTEEITLDEVTEDELWEFLVSADKDKAMISVGSFQAPGGDSQKNQVGISFSHAFSVLKTVQLSNPEQTRLVQVRNPWHLEYYKGPWSDNGPLWTDELLKEVGHTKENDGFFYISVEDFYTNFAMITVAQNVEGWSRAHFSVTGDDEPKDQEQIFSDSPASYNTYKLQVTSPVDQEVVISVHTYEPQQYVSDCYLSFYESEVYVYSEKETSLLVVNPGTANLKPIKMKAGDTFKFEVYTKFGEGDLLPHNWNVVALSEHQAVTVEEQTSKGWIFIVLIVFGVLGALTALICIIDRYCCKDRQNQRNVDHYQRL